MRTLFYYVRRQYSSRSKKEIFVMGRGFTSYNVWPAPSHSKESTVSVKEKEKNEIEDKEIEQDAKIADHVSKMLTPLIEALTRVTQKLDSSQGKAESTDSNSNNERLQQAKKTEKNLIIALIVVSVLALLSFLSALWSANSVEKLLRILYKLKQTKP